MAVLLQSVDNLHGACNVQLGGGGSDTDAHISGIADYDVLTGRYMKQPLRIFRIDTHSNLRQPGQAQSSEDNG
jgi:hypothetical protein